MKDGHTAANRLGASNDSGPYARSDTHTCTPAINSASASSLVRSSCMRPHGHGMCWQGPGIFGSAEAACASPKSVPSARIPLQEQQEQEQARQLALQPYLVGASKRGVIRESRHSKRVRRDILAAARDRERWVHHVGAHSPRRSRRACSSGRVPQHSLRLGVAAVAHAAAYCTCLQQRCGADK